MSKERPHSQEYSFIHIFLLIHAHSEGVPTNKAKHNLRYLSNIDIDNRILNYIDYRALFDFLSKALGHLGHSVKIV
jgi:hypothetical protein